MGAAAAKALSKEGQTFAEIADTLGVTARQARKLVEEGLERVAVLPPPNWGSLFRATRKNANKRGIPFEISTAEFQSLVDLSGGSCMVSNIPFEFDRVEDSWHKNPWRPSIDRIKSTEGYTLLNCRLVCVAANVAMNEWGLEVLRRLARGMFGVTEKVPLSRSGNGLPRGISLNVGTQSTTFVVRIADPLFGDMRYVGSYKTLTNAIAALKSATSDFAVAPR